MWFLLVLFCLALIGVEAETVTSCYRPEIPVHSVLNPDKMIYLSGDAVSYDCDTGGLSIKLESRIRTCVNGTWTGTTPRCLSADEMCEGQILSDHQCLTIHHGIRSWFDADRGCGQQSQLLVLSDQSTLDEAAQLLNRTWVLSPYRLDFAWIKSHSERVWRWSIDYTKIMMTDWAAGEPSNLRGNENRLQLRKAAGYRWNDADGNDKYEQVDGWSVNKYICEFDEPCGVNKFSPNPHTEMGGSCFVLTGKVYHDQFDGRCVEFNEVNRGHADPNFWKNYCKTRGISWYDANEACTDAGAHLAKLDTKDKIDSMRDFLIALTVTQNERKFAGNYWFGAMIDEQRDERVWNWGQKNLTIPSSLAEPSFSGAECGVLTASGDIEAKDCTDWYPSLCVREMTAVAPKNCGIPPQAANTKSIFQGGVYRPGTTMTQECDDGFVAEFGNTDCVCQESGLWDDQCNLSVNCTEISTTLPTTSPGDHNTTVRVNTVSVKSQTSINGNVSTEGPSSTQESSSSATTLSQTQTQAQNYTSTAVNSPETTTNGVDRNTTVNTINDVTSVNSSTAAAYPHSTANNQTNTSTQSTASMSSRRLLLSTSEMTATAPKDCGIPPQAANTKSIIRGVVYRPGTTMTQECDDGFVAEFGNTDCVCQDSGLWDDRCNLSVNCTEVSTTLPTASPGDRSTTVTVNTVTVNTVSVDSNVSTAGASSMQESSSSATTPSQTQAPAQNYTITTVNSPETTTNGVDRNTTVNTIDDVTSVNSSTAAAYPHSTANNQINTSTQSTASMSSRRLLLSTSDQGTVNSAGFLSRQSDNENAEQNPSPKYWWFVIGGCALVAIILIIVVTTFIMRKRRRQPPQCAAKEGSKVRPEFTTCDNPIFRVTDPQTLPHDTTISTYKGDRPFHQN